ncbi:MAG: hypothetical protein QOD30_2156, partial [Actinomycetota bacterium]|nr:hypothetical protein [Actinomycetota bacterium]
WVPDAATLSERLSAWLEADEPKTIAGLCERFGPQSFAIVFVVLLALSALPIPTGGVTHVLDIVAMLLSLELIAGRSEVWVPRRWCSTELRVLTNARGSNALLKRIRWFERFSRPRLTALLTSPVAPRVYGLLVLMLTAVAFLAPPFTGLDTLPALGVVVLSLGVLLTDALLAGIGVAIGAAGIALVVGLGHAITRLL